MKDTSQVLDYIDRLFNVWLDGPRQFVSDPFVLEQLCMQFEDLRTFILSDSQDIPSPGESGYVQYSSEERPDIGALGVTGHHYSRPYSKDDDAWYDAFREFWEGYLESKCRPTRE